MSDAIKSQAEILAKLDIATLHPMQMEALETIPKTQNTMLLSPTGTGKTLAFLLPLIQRLNPNEEAIQALILVPTRELAIQIEQVIRSMGSGYKVNAVYGGRAMAKDKIALKHTPAILVGTPGRINDHFRKERFTKNAIKTLILDEFDKSLELGFEDEMREIIKELTGLDKRILTSATQSVQVPNYVGFVNSTTINYLGTIATNLQIKTLEAPEKNKLNTLWALLLHLGNQQGIIFCNLKESIQIVSDFLKNKELLHGCFNGGMEQRDRERALIKFRNGTYRLLVATDLAARGIDIPEMGFIIHYELPIHKEEFIHRNGRTARVAEKGTAYVLKWRDQLLPDFIESNTLADIPAPIDRKPAYWATIFISGGRKDKISKGDIAGLFLKQGGIKLEELGLIELKQDCAFVSVPANLSKALVDRLNNVRLKKKKVRLSIV